MQVPTIDIRKEDGSILVEFTLVREDETEVYIEGTLVPYKSGRSTEYKLEIDWIDPMSEVYFDEHWEEVEEAIINKFHNQ